MNNSYSDALLASILKGTVSNAFEGLLTKNINIDKGIRGRASTSQNHLRDFLSSQHKSDPTFPRVLSKADQDFLGGSFDRHTKNWPLDDIDIYFPLDGYNLWYIQNYSRLPYTVMSDHVLAGNPLLGTKWSVGGMISSSKLIEGFATVLKNRYSRTEVKPNGQAVSLRMSLGETESEDGLGYDIVPCFFLKPDNFLEDAFYLIPDGNNGWIRTNPKIDSKITANLHVKNNETFRKVVKIIKYWNSEMLSGTFNSYYIELAIARGYESQNQAGKTINTLPFGIALGFWALNQAAKQGAQQPWLAGAPSVPSGTTKITDLEYLDNVQRYSEIAWDDELAERYDEALKKWKIIFGVSFGN